MAWRTGIVLTILFLTPRAVAAADERVVLRVYESSGLRLETVIPIVRRVLARAGIEALWVSCADGGVHDGCSGELTVHDLVVRVRPGVAPDGSQVCGAALIPDPPASGHYISVYSDCAARVADQFLVPLDTVLAHCLLHEIGHVLLSAASHAPFGIMASTLHDSEWQLAAAGRLGFSKAQAARMRERLRMMGTGDF